MGSSPSMRNETTRQTGQGTITTFCPFMIGHGVLFYSTGTLGPGPADPRFVERDEDGLAMLVPQFLKASVNPAFPNWSAVYKELCWYDICTIL